MFLFLTAAHGRAQVLLFTFVCENVSRKSKRHWWWHAHASGPGFESPQYPAFFLLWLQASLPCPPKDSAIPRSKVLADAQGSAGSPAPLSVPSLLEPGLGSNCCRSHFLEPPASGDPSSFIFVTEFQSLFAPAVWLGGR